MTFHNSALARLVPDGNYRAGESIAATGYASVWVRDIEHAISATTSQPETCSFPGLATKRKGVSSIRSRPRTTGVAIARRAQSRIARDRSFISIARSRRSLTTGVAPTCPTFDKANTSRTRTCRCSGRRPIPPWRSRGCEPGLCEKGPDRGGADATAQLSILRPSCRFDHGNPGVICSK